MELRQLKYFVAVAEELHFNRAAARLNISQPPLSRQIRQLEKEIGTPLFYRTKHHVELTPAGKNFLKQTYQIIHLVEKACEDVRKVGLGESGKMVLGYAGTMHDFLLQMLLNYRAKVPNVKVVLQQLSTSEQIEALHKGQIDIGVLSPPIDTTSLNLRRILRVPFVAALPPNHHLAADTSPLNLFELAEEPFIMSPRQSSPSYFDTIISMCHKAGFSPKIIQEAQGISTVLVLVSAGMGISIVTVLAKQHQSHGVVYRDLNTDKTMETSLVWRKDEPSSVVTTFLTLANEFLEEKSRN